MAQNVTRKRGMKGNKSKIDTLILWAVPGAATPRANPSIRQHGVKALHDTTEEPPSRWPGRSASG
jgi:hypothetical protein